MKKQDTPKNRRRPTAGKVLGREWGEKISAVEGIKLSSAARKRASEFERLDLSPAERRKAIIDAHRKD
jgi:hypothetical protein